MRRLPPLNALRAFDAAARHQSFTRAAEELSVTQGAVSQQVRALEAELGLKLFIRKPRMLSLTEAGRAYLIVIRDALDRISVGTQQIIQSKSSGALTVSTSPNFASKWLVNRLGQFAERHPEIDLRVSATLHHVDFASEGVDLAIRHSEEPVAGLNSTKLCNEELFPGCAPGLVRGRRALRQPSDLSRHPLIHLDSRKDWKKWLDAASIDVDLSKGPVLNQASMVIDAAIDAQGVALARTALAAHDLISGRLVRPFARSTSPCRSHMPIGSFVLKVTLNCPKLLLSRLGWHRKWKLTCENWQPRMQQ